MGGVATKKRNGVAREFEAGGHTVLLAGTGTLNRGMTINGANHVIIMNTEWSPETTLQAEDRCHRLGQTKDVYVHYILSAGTVEEQMWELIHAKEAAQRAVFDKEALYKSVEQVMAEAVGAQMQVAQAVLTVEREPLPEPELTVESAPGCEHIPPQQSARQLTMADLFQCHGAHPTKGQHCRKQTAVAQQLNLFGRQSAVSAP